MGSLNNLEQKSELLGGRRTKMNLHWHWHFVHWHLLYDGTLVPVRTSGQNQNQFQWFQEAGTHLILNVKNGMISGVWQQVDSSEM